MYSVDERTARVGMVEVGKLLCSFDSSKRKVL